MLKKNDAIVCCKFFIVNKQPYTLSGKNAAFVRTDVQYVDADSLFYGRLRGRSQFFRAVLVCQERLL